jgi:plastocyanin domain-containing protein
MLIINVLGLVLIVLIIWWFWLYKPAKVVDSSTEKITIVVNNGIYSPAKIKVPADKINTLEFLRKDASPCAASVLFPDFEINVDLPVDEVINIELPAMPAGEYPFHCPMKMYIGTLLVE